MSNEYNLLRDELLAEAKDDLKHYKYHAQLIKAFHLAWELGHANGIDEVKGHFWDIKAVIDAK